MTGKAPDDREYKTQISFDVFFPGKWITFADACKQGIFFIFFEYGELGSVDTADLDFVCRHEENLRNMIYYYQFARLPEKYTHHESFA